MNGEYLYHFFPRKDRSPCRIMDVLEGIVGNGILLNKEVVEVGWEDHFGTGDPSTLELEQWRFCLTAIGSRTELKSHCKDFGPVGIGFSMRTILDLGGFPVFYVPAPDGTRSPLTQNDFNGVSLLYRLGEIQRILEHTSVRLLAEQSMGYDHANLLGAIRMMANITYPTTRLAADKKVYPNYYGQREWRLIKGMLGVHGLTETVFNGEKAYFLGSYGGTPMYKWVEHVVVDRDACSGADMLPEKIASIFKASGVETPLEII